MEVIWLIQKERFLVPEVEKGGLIRKFHCLHWYLALIVSA